MRQQTKMNTKFAEFEGRLLERRAELAAELRAQQASCMPSLRAGDADEARVLHDRFVAERLSSLAAQRLREVDSALARLRKGEYGTCVDCEGSISARRLAAIPWAERCIACEEAYGARLISEQQIQPAA